MHLWSSTSPSPYANTSTDYIDTYDDDVPQAYIHPPGRTLFANNIGLPTSVDDCDAETRSDSTALSESTRLKGIYWPGMDIFDSATPEMRRKRNQKKDTSVIEQLEANSKVVEPNELIFTPSGSLKRQRRMSGSTFDEDSSPIKPRSSPAITTHQNSRVPLEELDRSRSVSDLSFPRSHQADIQRVLMHDAGHSDIALSIKDLAPTRKRLRSFDVFQDTQLGYPQPTTFNYLTSEFQYVHPSEAMPYQHNGSRLQNLTLHHQEDRTLSAPTQMPFPYGHVYVNQPHPSNLFSYTAQDMSINFLDSPFPYCTTSAFPNVEHENDDQRTLTAPSSEED
jgi:hypothetical protein